MAEEQVWQSEHSRADTDLTYLNTPIEARMIRLLIVHDYDSQGLLNCSLSTAQLDELPNFIALSYTWGKEEATQKIVVNGHRCMIRRNLYNFLDSVAAKSLRGELLFIDAICIDQSNIEERASQVSHMGTIYSIASRVIAWLGLADELLYQRLANVKETVAQLRHGGLGAFSSESHKEAVLGKFQELLDAEDLHVGLAEEHINQIGASPDLLVDLMNPGGFSFSYDRPFWRRVWIVQEMILAQHLTIQVGEYSLSPEDYLLGIMRSPMTSSRDANKSMRDVRPEGRITKPAKGLLLDREYWRRRVLNGPPIQLYEIILRFGFQQASEPLDHVFGFLGLARTGVRANYHLTRVELYTYVLTEGAQYFNKPKITRQDSNTLQVFHYACLSAFGFSATNTTIAAITDRAFSLSCIPIRIRFLVAEQSLYLEKFEALRDDTSSEQGYSRKLRWSTIIGQALWALGYSFASYARLCVSLWCYRFFDWNLTAPQGEMGKYATWMAFVEDTFIRVKQDLPPRQTISPSQNTNSSGMLEASSPLVLDS